jgi:hypothetical protein
LVAAFALIAFAFQSYLTQTHIHLLPPLSAPSKTAAVSDSGTTKIGGDIQRHAPKKAPADDNPLKCPLCQAVSYAGHFLTPSPAASLLQPALSFSILPLRVATPSSRESPSHNWQGRGPPHS